MSEALVNTVHGDRRRSSSVSTKQSRENLSRKHSERHQVMKIQNYVIYRKTIGAGSMGKVKLAECLTDIHKQKVFFCINYCIPFRNLTRQKSMQ